MGNKYVGRKNDKPETKEIDIGTVGGKNRPGQESAHDVWLPDRLAHLKSIEEDALLLLDGEADHLPGLLVDGAVFVLGDALDGIAGLEEPSARFVVRELLLRFGIERHLLLLLVGHVQRSDAGRRGCPGPSDEGARRSREGIGPARKEGQGHGEESGVHPEGHLDTDDLFDCGTSTWLFLRLRRAL